MKTSTRRAERRLGYRITYAGAHMGTLTACRAVTHQTLAAAVAAIGRVSAYRSTVCRTNRVHGTWYVYRSSEDRRADRNGDAPNLVLATIEPAWSSEEP
jgi:hypothetical protein